MQIYTSFLSGNRRRLYIRYDRESFKWRQPSIALDKGVQFITQAIKASYGFDYPKREGVLLEKVLEVLNMPVVIGGYEMLE